MTDVNYLGDNRPDGICMGTSDTEKIAFHGETPVARQTVTIVATGSTAATIVTRLRALWTALDNLGLITK